MPVIARDQYNPSESRYNSRGIGDDIKNGMHVLVQFDLHLDRVTR